MFSGALEHACGNRHNVFISSHSGFVFFSQKYPGQVSLSVIDIIMNHLSAATDKKKAVKRMRWFFRLCRKWQNGNNCGALQLRKDINMGGQRRESERGHNGARSARL